MSEIAKKYSAIKPTIQTPYFIDFEWWKNNDRDWHVILSGYLPEVDRKKYEKGDFAESFDIVDAQTAEVKQIDALQHLLMIRFVKKEGFTKQTTSLVESIFRLLLANGNNPMSSEEISEHLERSPQLILQILSGKRVYQGLRPLTK